MKSIYSFVLIGAVVLATLASANAEMGRPENRPMMGTGVMVGSGMLGSGMINRGQLVKNVMQQMNQQRKDMRDNRRNGSGAINGGITVEQLTCVRTAVAKRETAILSASMAFSTATNSGLVARASALNTAWSITGSTDRKMARQAAWTNWKNVVKAAQMTNKISRDSAWKTYRTEAQTCKLPEALTESEGGDVRMEQDWTGNHD